MTRHHAPGQSKTDWPGTSVQGPQSHVGKMDHSRKKWNETMGGIKKNRFYKE
jgi:hypothetical protein